MAVLASWSGGLLASLPAIVVLTGVLVAAGYVFGWLIQTERIRSGFGHGIVYWSIVFPVARLLFELMIGDDGSRAGLSNGVAGFLVYQAMVGGAFGLGFVLLHNHVVWLLDWRAGRSTRDKPGTTEPSGRR
jgi:hypothetical protein